MSMKKILRTVVILLPDFTGFAGKFQLFIDEQTVR